jgi:hypothetical protein
MRGPTTLRSRRLARTRPGPGVALLLIAATTAAGAAGVLAGPAAGPAGGSDGAPALAPPSAAGEGGTFAGRSLTDALLTLQARGLAIVFTSQLVRPEMTVAAEPAATDPRRILDELLAPHGLRAEDAPGGTVVVVAAAPPPAPGSIGGTVSSGEGGAPLSGVSIRLAGAGAEAVSDAAGRFRIDGLAPGAYALEARLHDFLPAEVRGVEVGADRPAEVALVLQPIPFIRDEIVVRPSRLALLDDQPPAPLSLSRGDLQGLPHLAGDVFRALSLLPGAAANDVTAQFHVHGGRRDEVQILLDGQELYEAYHLQDFDRALSVVPSEGLASASLATGAFPANRGDRMSGVLDMTTQTPSGPPHTRLSLSLLSAAATGGGAFDDERGAWLASARRGSTDLAGRLLGSEDPSFWDLFGKVGYRLGPRHGLRLHLLHAADALGFREVVDGDRKRWSTDYDSSYLWLTDEAALGSRLLVETSASWSRLDRDRRGVEAEDEQAFAVIDRRDVQVLGLAQSWSFQATPRTSVKWGLEGRRYDADYDYFNEVERDLAFDSPLARPPTGLTRFAGGFRGEHLGAYAAVRLSPEEPLTLEVGLRHDRHGLTDDAPTSPRVNLAWRLGERSVLRASWGRFYQSQRPYELHVEDGESRFHRAERSAHQVVGYERLFGPGAPLRALRVEAYRREIDDPRPRYENLYEPRNTFPEIEPDRVRIAPEESRAEGIELTLRGAAGARVEWWANYAWARAEDSMDGIEVPRQIDQTHTVNAYVSRRLGRSWSLSLAWRYHTGWPTTPLAIALAEGEDGEPRPVPVLGRLNADRLSDYHRLDLRASRQWALRSGRLTFFVDLQNVYGRENLAGFDLTLDDETGELRRAAETWPGLVPSAGVSWEF